MMRDMNSHAAQLVITKLYNVLLHTITNYLLLVSDTDVSSSKQSSEQERHKQSHNTTGKVIEPYCVCYYLLLSVISFGTSN